MTHYETPPHLPEMNSGNPEKRQGNKKGSRVGDLHRDDRASEQSNGLQTTQFTKTHNPWMETLDAPPQTKNTENGIPNEIPQTCL